jgi:hypothetical protein
VKERAVQELSAEFQNRNLCAFVIEENQIRLSKEMQLMAGNARELRLAGERLHDSPSTRRSEVAV